MGPERSQPAAVVTRRLSELASAYELDGEQELRLRELLALVAEDAHAPTTVRDPAAAVDAHVADSLSCLELQAVRSASRIGDLGAGAGFPGLPLAIALSSASVALVESSARKCAFLARAVERTRAANARVVNSRAEDWSQGAGANDVVTARALAALAVVCEYAAPLLAVGGQLVAWRGRRNADEEHAAEAAAAQLGLEPAGVLSVAPFAAARDRHLHLYLKVRETPERFPRRAGIARKRPLGG